LVWIEKENVSGVPVSLRKHVKTAQKMLLMLGVILNRDLFHIRVGAPHEDSKNKNNSPGLIWSHLNII